MIDASSLDEIISTIRNTISQGVLKSKSVVKKEQTKAYWSAGKTLYESFKNIETESIYGKSLFQEIAEATNISCRSLYLMHQFYNEYPDLNEKDNLLSWTHYRVLLTVDEKEKRDILEKKIIEKNLSTRELREEVKAKKKNKQKNNSIKEKIGAMHHYKIYEDLNRKEKFIDLGFRTYKKLQPDSELSKGKIIKVLDENILNYEVIKTNKKNLFNYKARVQKVLDANNILLKIELGFGINVIQKVKLRGVSCPDIITDEGLKAKSYIKSKLSSSDIVYIKSFKRDKNNIYLVDIYTKIKIESSENHSNYFLNQILIDKKHGVFVSN